MPQVFVANCTRQYQNIFFRLDLDEDGKKNALAQFRGATQVSIAPGRQDRLAGSLTPQQADSVIKQIEPYGLVQFDEVDRTDRVIPYIYRMDAPIPTGVIEKVTHLNMGILSREGERRRKQAAIAVNNLVNSTVNDHLIQNGIDAQPSGELDVSFEQEDGEVVGIKPVSEGYHVKPVAAAAHHHQDTAKAGKGRR